MRGRHRIEPGFSGSIQHDLAFSFLPHFARTNLGLEALDADLAKAAKKAGVKKLKQKPLPTNEVDHWPIYPLTTAISGYPCCLFSLSGSLKKLSGPGPTDCGHPCPEKASDRCRHTAAAREFKLSDKFKLQHRPLAISARRTLHSLTILAMRTYMSYTLHCESEAIPKVPKSTRGGNHQEPWQRWSLPSQIEWQADHGADAR